MTVMRRASRVSRVAEMRCQTLAWIIHEQPKVMTYIRYLGAPAVRLMNSGLPLRAAASAMGPRPPHSCMATTKTARADRSSSTNWMMSVSTTPRKPPNME